MLSHSHVETILMTRLGVPLTSAFRLSLKPMTNGSHLDQNQHWFWLFRLI